MGERQRRVGLWVCPARGDNSPPHPQHPSKINYPWADASLDLGVQQRSTHEVTDLFKPAGWGQKDENFESSNAKRERRSESPSPERNPHEPGLQSTTTVSKLRFFLSLEQAAFLKAAPFHKSFLYFFIFLHDTFDFLLPRQTFFREEKKIIK